MHISVVTLPVNDIDQAVRFYMEKLGWKKTMDAPMGKDMRWVTVAPDGGQAEFTLSKGTGHGSLRQPGGFSGVVFHVDDVRQTIDGFKKKGVEITEGPRDEPWGVLGHVQGLGRQHARDAFAANGAFLNPNR